MQREKVEQAHILQLLQSLGAKVYVLGTRRRRGDYQGTMQTPGVPDLLAFLPPPPRAERTHVLLCIEAKAAGGRASPPQREFRDLCRLAAVAHVTGDLDAVIAWLCEHGYCRRDQFPHYRQPPARELAADEAGAAVTRAFQNRLGALQKERR